MIVKIFGNIMIEANILVWPVNIKNYPKLIDDNSLSKDVGQQAFAINLVASLTHLYSLPYTKAECRKKERCSLVESHQCSDT